MPARDKMETLDDYLEAAQPNGLAFACCQTLKLATERNLCRGTHTIDKENAVQVVGLMLSGARQQSFGLKFDRFSLEVGGLHCYPSRARDICTHFGETQAALRANFCLPTQLQLWI